jgi:hypothetical protein
LSVLGGQFLSQPVNVHGVLVSLFGEFVRGQVISFTVRDRSRSVGMGRKVVEFCDPIVDTLWHGVLPADCMTTAAVRARFSLQRA